MQNTIRESSGIILVDEYQDTNTAIFAHKYSGTGIQKSLRCGDDDQSIYGWRGANIRNILDFEKEFKRYR